MKMILTLSILFSVVALPAMSELTTQDLEKIRQIVKESETTLTSRIEKSEATLTSRIEKVESKVDAIETRLRTVETGVAELRGRSLGFGVLRDWIVTLCAVGALIISIFALVKTQPKATQTPQETQKAASQ